MTNIDFSEVLRGFDDQPLKEPDGKPILLRAVCCNALTAQVQGDTPTAVDKVRRFSLAQRISREDSLALTAEEVAMCKMLIDKVYGTLLVAASFAILDPAPSA